jgi:sarcosine oxidase subunit gamma
LTAITALGGIEARDDLFGGVRITEVADTCLASLAMRRGKAARFRKAAQTALGTDLPAPGQRTGDDTRGVIWMGPDQFLVEAETGTTDLATSLATSLSGTFGVAASITDQSDAWVRFDITGRDVPAMLERLSAADTRQMQGGAAVRTPVHHMLCVLVCRDAGIGFTVYGPRASAQSLHHALTAAAASLQQS